MNEWQASDSSELYNVPNWSAGYFRISPSGNVEAVPDPGAGPEAPSFDLFDLMGQVRRRGIATPLLLRFDGILRGRVRELHEAFGAARREYGYPAPYMGVYPIKVNQQRLVVETLMDEGHKHGMGLEVGSKPELLAAIAMKTRGEMIIVCNGYKDEDFIETALLSGKLGIRPILVIEKTSELDTILASSRRLGIRPIIGIRTKLWGHGSGRWMQSGGVRSKFGLTTRQIVGLVEVLRGEDMLDCLQLLHFHIGSQITNIRAVKDALREATRVLLGLTELGAEIRWFDVGGGLGIDYDGSSSNAESSVNYSLQEYANDVVYHLVEACQESGLKPPAILSESGRALTAHHTVLITELLGVSEFSTAGSPLAPEEDEHELVHHFAEIHDEVTGDNFQESYHDALQIRDEAMVMFGVGQIGLPERARIEEFFWRTCRRILDVTRSLDYVPDDLSNLERDLADTYFLNFSLFQSLPDSWAIHQLFPVVPLHRHTEEPTRRAVLADITCDSDGRIDRFVALRGEKRTLELHDPRPGEPYYLGIFLVGAYQEILGDMHNLFGDPNIVHVDHDPEGRPRLTHVVRGDRTQEVLSYVEFFEPDLLARLRTHIEQALAAGRMTYEESALLQRRYEDGLASYTYLAGHGAPPDVRTETPIRPGAGDGPPRYNPPPAPAASEPPPNRPRPHA